MKEIPENPKACEDYEINEFLNDKSIINREKGLGELFPMMFFRKHQLKPYHRKNPKNPKNNPKTYYVNEKLFDEYSIIQYNNISLKRS